MAGIRKMRNKWYARIYLWDGFSRTEKLIPLKTTQKVTALERLFLVNRFEVDIKNGVEISFPWTNDKQELKIIHITLTQAINDFLRSRHTQGLANSTITRNINSLSLFSTIIGKSIPIERISTRHIDVFKGYCTHKRHHSPTTININLRLIKTFFRWCVNNGLKRELPLIQMVKIPKSLPSYIPDDEWNKINQTNVVDELYKEIFFFARETGCRLAEPYHGNLDGDWLIIPAEFTKSKVEREIFLSDELKGIWYKMMAFLDEWIESGKKYKNFLGNISKSFLKVCRYYGINHHYHDLRHTFAVRRYLQTGNIYGVKDELGHASVITTEKYAKFRLRRLKHDFPSIITSNQNGQNSSFTGITDTDYTDTREVTSTVQQ
ncbi:MAG: phage integrase N-terminal SAM-like domain-containing protein [Candidatus Neomarinimicrobiota bacterium]